MLVAPAILIMLAIHPLSESSEEGKPDANKCQPGPRVTQEISRLEHESRAAYKQFRDGRISQLSLIREMARLKTTIETLRSWSCENHSDEAPQLVVIVDSDDYLEVFPRGMKHIAGRLVAGETYPAAPRDSRQWQYLGERRVSGMRVAIFRYAPGESAAKV